MTLNDYLVGIHWHDVIVVGAGHNGLVAALLLARRGLKVLVVEERELIGGAARTERPFAKAPDLAASTGAHLFGFMPPELVAKVCIEPPLVRRDPHTLLPLLAGGYVAFGTGPLSLPETKQAVLRFFSEDDWRAYEAMHAELAALRDDVTRSWLEPPRTIEATAEAFVRKPLQSAFVELCRKSAGDYIDRWGFRSEHLRAMLAAVAGYSGTADPWTTPGTGMSLLVQSMCRLPESGGAPMVVQGGLGTVPRMIADEAVRNGVILETGAKVGHVVVENGVARGVALKDGRVHRATAILCGADPLRMRELVGRASLPADYNDRLDAYRRDGGALKVCLALAGRPKLACWPGGAFDDPTFAATTHLLPETDARASSRAAYAAARHGKLPDEPAMQLHVDTGLAPDAEGRVSASLFVQPVPYELEGTSWKAEEDRYVRHLLSICDRYAPGFAELVVEAVALHPAKLEERFGISRGQIDHVDNAFGFADRLPYATPIQGLYSCSAGTHPAGGVIGAAGHNAAMRVLEDMGKASRRPPPA